jgi:hypothetical protein
MSQAPLALANSRHGICSFSAGVFIWALNVVMFLFLFVVRLGANSAEPVLETARAIGGIDFMMWLGSLLGVAWGVVGLLQRKHKKTLAVWGMALNGAFFLGMILLGIAMSMTK